MATGSAPWRRFFRPAGQHSRGDTGLPMATTSRWQAGVEVLSGLAAEMGRRRAVGQRFRRALGHQMRLDEGSFGLAMEAAISGTRRLGRMRCRGKPGTEGSSRIFEASMDLGERDERGWGKLELLDGRAAAGGVRVRRERLRPSSRVARDGRSREWKEDAAVEWRELCLLTRWLRWKCRCVA